jgi:hypothetical protein
MYRIIACVALFLFIAALPCVAAGVNLEKDTPLPIQCKGIKVLFAGGTKVLLNDNKEVRRGILAENTALNVPGIDMPVLFAKSSEIMFNVMGLVEQGIMVNDMILKVDGSKKPLKFKGGCKVIFGISGLSCGTLAEATSLPNPKKRGAEEVFPPGTYVMFTITGGIYLIEPKR